MEKLIALKHKLDAIKTMGTNAKKEALATLMNLSRAWSR